MSNGSHTRVEWGLGPRGGSWDDPSRHRLFLDTIPLATEAEVAAAAALLRRHDAWDVAEALGVAL